MPVQCQAHAPSAGLNMVVDGRPFLAASISQTLSYERYWSFHITVAPEGTSTSTPSANSFPRTSTDLSF